MKMEKKSLLSILLAFIMIITCMPLQAAGLSDDQFSYESFQGSSVTIPYRKAEINPNASIKPALVICLHGHSASGTDNEKQLKKEHVKKSAEYFINKQQSAIILAPQCNDDHYWYDKVMVKTLRELIASFEDQIDKTRIYILGDSVGGGGSWAMISAYPDLFAAAMPAVSVVRGDLKSIASTPVCYVIGDEDDVVSPEKVTPDIEELIALGAEVKFEILPGEDHPGACKNAFTDENIEWVFSHVRKQQQPDPNVVSINDAAVTGIADKTWTGKSLTQIPVVKVAGKTLKSNADYTISYKNNKNVGKATVTITGTGGYTGTVTKTFKINPKGTSLSKVTKAKKAATVKWNKQSSKMTSSRVTGYQIQLATNSKFTKNKKTVNVKGYSKISKKVTSLKGGKKYWVRIRTYKKVESTTYYSPWSKTKTVTTKK